MVRALYEAHRSDFLARSLQSLLEAHYSYDRHAPEPGAEQQKHADAVEKERNRQHMIALCPPRCITLRSAQNVMVVPKPVEIFKSEAMRIMPTRSEQHWCVRMSRFVQAH